MTTWIKVYNTMPSHPKFVRAGDRAAWLYICGLCYSNEHLTDGFISSYALLAAAPGVKQPDMLASRLVAAGLWHEREDGWQIHDYDQHQRSAGEIRDKRAREAERKATVRQKSTRTPRGQNAESAKSPRGVRALDVEVDVDVDVEVEVKNNNAELRSAVTECFAYWQERCGHKAAQLSADRRGKIERRLRDRTQLRGTIPLAIVDVRQAIDGAAIAPFIDESGKRFDDIELICRTGSKLEDFMGRATRGVNGGRVMPFHRPNASDLLRKLGESEASGEAS